MYLPVMWEECEVFHVLFFPEIRSKKEEIWEVQKAENLQKESKIYDKNRSNDENYRYNQWL